MKKTATATATEAAPVATAPVATKPARVTAAMRGGVVTRIVHINPKDVEALSAVLARAAENARKSKNAETQAQIEAAMGLLEEIRPKQRGRRRLSEG